GGRAERGRGSTAPLISLSDSGRWGGGKFSTSILLDSTGRRIVLGKNQHRLSHHYKTQNPSDPGNNFNFNSNFNNNVYSSSRSS
ncbi:unnamed protein product, partial [Discosporangium mesarthrocarpum]